MDTLLDSIKADDSGITFVAMPPVSSVRVQLTPRSWKRLWPSQEGRHRSALPRLDELRESEGLDRADMKLAENQQRLLAAAAAVNPTSSFC